VIVLFSGSFFFVAFYLYLLAEFDDEWALLVEMMTFPVAPLTKPFPVDLVDRLSALGEEALLDELPPPPPSVTTVAMPGTDCVQ
jgi:hypothetical protein